MPGRAKGNQREAAVIDALDALGYYVWQIKGSGARGAKMRRRKNPVIGDAFAIGQELPWLQIEIGNHSAKAAFAALRAHAMPCFAPLAVLYVYRLTKAKERSKKAVARWYVDEHTWYPSASEAVVAIRER